MGKVVRQTVHHNRTQQLVPILDVPTAWTMANPSAQHIHRYGSDTTLLTVQPFDLSAASTVMLPALGIYELWIVIDMKVSSPSTLLTVVICRMLRCSSSSCPSATTAETKLHAQTRRTINSRTAASSRHGKHCIVFTVEARIKANPSRARTTFYDLGRLDDDQRSLWCCNTAPDCV